VAGQKAGGAAASGPSSDPSFEPEDEPSGVAIAPEDDPLLEDDPASGRSPNGFPPLDPEPSAEGPPPPAVTTITRGMVASAGVGGDASPGVTAESCPPHPETNPGATGRRVPTIVMSTRRPFQPLEPFD
jgi:hypothetical protein